MKGILEIVNLQSYWSAKTILVSSSGRTSIKMTSDSVVSNTYHTVRSDIAIWNCCRGCMSNTKAPRSPLLAQRYRHNRTSRGSYMAVWTQPKGVFWRSKWQLFRFEQEALEWVRVDRSCPEIGLDSVLDRDVCEYKPDLRGRDFVFNWTRNESREAMAYTAASGRLENGSVFALSQCDDAALKEDT